MNLFGQKKEYNSGSLEKKLLSQFSRSRLPNLKQIKYLKRFLSKKEKWVLNISLIILVISAVFLFNKFWNNHLVITPKNGGNYIEGTLTAPSHINPLFFGLNSTDDDLVKLIYSSLWQRDKNGSLKQDLVTNLEVSADQKTYTVTITDKAKWQSGENLTVDDILFTFDTIKDSRFKSPWRRYFISVVTEKINDQQFKITLKEPYAPFLEYLTFGILPKHLWQDINPDSVNLAELNIKPVGSGPFEFKSLTKDKSGAIRTYNLKANKNYYLPTPHINEFAFKIFVSPEEIIDALNNNKIDSINYLPASYKKSILATNSYNFFELQQPELLALFFNLKKEGPTTSLKVRQAMALALNKQDIINQVYGTGASIADSPIPNCAFGYSPDITKYNYDTTKAKELLLSDGWKEITNASNSTTVLQKSGQNLKVSITTINNEDDIKLANLIAENWKAIGIQTEIITEEKNSFYTQVIKPKNYNIILYSILNNLNSDPYAFWHSSQIDDKGYNLSNYSNTKIDRLLEESRMDGNLAKRQANYLQFQKTITEDEPAIFLANQNFLYIQSKKVKGFNTITISSPEDRLYGIGDWYLNEKKTLKF